jgi:hypothetical protein
MATPQQYTLGRGKCYFSRFLPGTQTPEGYRYIGNTPELALTIDSEELEHFSSDEGIREKDDSVPLQVTRTGNFTTDNIDMENVAMFFFGEASVLTQTTVASTAYPLTVSPGMHYQLGQSDSNPVGHRGINPTGITVTSDPVGTTFTAGDDYVVNTDTGMLEIPEDSAIAEDADILVTYAVLASTRDHAVSGSEPVEGAFKFIAFNPKGPNRDYTMPWVKITPNGDYNLKGDEWQAIPFNLESLKPVGKEAIYVDGRPAFS